MYLCGVIINNVKEMSEINNPFIVKGRIPAACFCDRVAETEKLTRELLNGNDVVIMSSRRLGKTGLIQHCFDQSAINGHYYTFFVDILETSSMQEFVYKLSSQLFETLKPMGRKFVDFFVNSLKSLQAGWTYDPLSGMPKFTFSMGAFTKPEVTLGEIFAMLEQADRRCIVAIDEFQQIAKYPEKNVEAVLRGFIQHLKNCDFIFAGSERHLLAEMFSAYGRPFYNSTSTLNLDPIPKDRYTEFVIDKFLQYKKSVEAEFVGRIYDLCEGNTFCMQKIFNTAFSLTDKECTLEILLGSILDILADKERDYQNILSQVTSRPKEVLFAIANDGFVDRPTSSTFVRCHYLVSASSVQSAIKQLLQNDLITFSLGCNGRKIYRLSDPFLKMWIRQATGYGLEI